MLREYGHEVVAHGLRTGMVEDVTIHTDWYTGGDIDTVTLYLNPARQQEYYEEIIKLKPRRVIFNPGTENNEFVQRLSDASIASEEACTLVLLRTEQF